MLSRGEEGPRKEYSLVQEEAIKTRPMLSVVLSIGGGMVRHFTSFDVGRWRGRLGEKCL
jgi:hypothetical protein